MVSSKRQVLSRSGSRLGRNPLAPRSLVSSPTLFGMERTVVVSVESKSEEIPTAELALDFGKAAIRFWAEAVSGVLWWKVARRLLQP